MSGLVLGGRIEGADIPDPGSVISPRLMAAISESIALLEREVKLATPIGVTGSARGSIGHQIRRGGSVERGVRVRAELGSPQRHVPVLAGGRRPGARRPPAEALELWVRRKLGIVDRSEARGVAFVIARAIGRRGTRGLEMFERAAEENEDRIQRIFDAAGLDITVRLARGGS